MLKLALVVFSLFLYGVVTEVNANSQFKFKSLNYVSNSNDPSLGSVWPQPQSMQSYSEVSYH